MKTVWWRGGSLVVKHVYFTAKDGECLGVNFFFAISGFFRGFEFFLSAQDLFPKVFT